MVYSKLACGLSLFLLIGCGTTRGLPQTFNTRLSADAPAGTIPIDWRASPTCANTGAEPPKNLTVRYTAIAADRCPHADRDFIALAFSGGGSKAAIYSGEAMFYLDALGVLSHADMLSSVSGGSFATSYYALSCEPPVTKDKCVASDGRQKPIWAYTESMQTLEKGFVPIVEEAERNFFIPKHDVLVTPEEFGDFIDRTYLGEGKDRTGKKPFTFKDINPYRPALVLNSTLLSDFRNSIEIGRSYLRRRTADEYFHVAFTDYYFKQIGSDIGAMPLGYGVASSAAFPALIGNPVLWNNKNVDLCRDPGAFSRVEDIPPGCALSLTDGGANDNQGLIEIFAALAEIADCQSRSDLSKEADGQCINHFDQKFDVMHPPLEFTKYDPEKYRQNEIQRMQRGDRALVLVINSSITESTGVQGLPSHDGSFLERVFGSIIGTLERVSSAVDTYSAVSYNLRKRLYEVDLDYLNRSLKDYDEVLLTYKEIALVTLDRYRSGGAQATLIDSANLPDTDWLRDEHSRLKNGDRPKRADFQKGIYDRLSAKNVRDDLSLGDIHPQCLFEQSKLAETGLLSLAELSHNNAACIKRAARWATALRAEELCIEQGNQDKDARRPLNDPKALNCENGHLAGLTPKWKMALDTLKDKGKDCDLTDGEGRNTLAENKIIFQNLKANATFNDEVGLHYLDGKDERNLAVVCKMTEIDKARASMKPN